MDTWELVVVVGLVIVIHLLRAAVVASIVRLRRRGTWFDQLVRSRVIVHTHDERSWVGVLVDVAPDGVLLTAVRLVGRDEVDLAGDVWIPRAQVLMVQRPPVEA